MAAAVVVGSSRTTDPQTHLPMLYYAAIYTSVQKYRANNDYKLDIIF